MLSFCAEKLQCIMKTSPSRILEFKGTLRASEMEKKMKMFRELEASPEPIILDIDTVGGDLEPSIDLFFALEESKNMVLGVVNTTAYSAGFIILQGCKIRYASPRATFRLHTPLFPPPDINITWDMEEETYLEEHRKVFRNSQQRLFHARNGVMKILQEKSNILKYDQIDQLLKSEATFDALTALSYGFLDEIL
jgi:ATP-dependent protease ClpP protease subunit